MRPKTQYTAVIFDSIEYDTNDDSRTQLVDMLSAAYAVSFTVLEGGFMLANYAFI